MLGSQRPSLPTPNFLISVLHMMRGEYSMDAAHAGVKQLPCKAAHRHSSAHVRKAAEQREALVYSSLTAHTSRGMKRKRSPSPAPCRVTPLKNRMAKIRKGT